MSLYNALFKNNPLIQVVITSLGFNTGDIERLRDAYIKDNKIVIYTRLGGGNRPHYQEAINYLINNELYIKDYDDDFDSTYAYFEYQIPKEIENIVGKIIEYQGDSRSISEKFKELKI